MIFYVCTFDTWRGLVFFLSFALLFHFTLIALFFCAQWNEEISSIHNTLI